jgi:sugar lactone lactonase YvrE
MIGLLRRGLDQIRGTGEASVTIPSMDGAFRPNSLLDEAEVVANIEAPDNLAHDGTRTLLTSGSAVLNLEEAAKTGARRAIFEFDSPISALATLPSGTLAIGLDDGRIMLRGGRYDGRVITKAADRPLVCLTALAFADPQTLIVALGSRTNPPRSWKRDLMQRNASGSIWKFDLESGSAALLGDRMAYPYGLASLPSGRVIVSEAWRHRLVSVGADGKSEVVLGDLPGYPSRISLNRNGGYWLCLFAPRRQMVEFVLREPDFLKQMVRDVPEDFWMAPALSSGRSFEEPLQGGAVRHLGINKPWAPTRSYGMLVELNEAFSPLRSAHSRADGKRHGLTSALSLGEKVLVASKGGDVTLALNVGHWSEG